MSRKASGLMAWLAQRATAVYLAIFSTYLMIHFTFDPPVDHAALLAWVNNPIVLVSLLLFIPVVLVHAFIGIRDVMIDYIHILTLRMLLNIFFTFTFIASGLLMFKAIATAGIGG